MSLSTSACTRRSAGTCAHEPQANRTKQTGPSSACCQSSRRPPTPSASCSYQGVYHAACTPPQTHLGVGLCQARVQHVVLLHRHHAGARRQQVLGQVARARAHLKRRHTAQQGGPGWLCACAATGAGMHLRVKPLPACLPACLPHCRTAALPAPLPACRTSSTRSPGRTPAARTISRRMPSSVRKFWPRDLRAAMTCVAAGAVQRRECRVCRDAAGVAAPRTS